MLVGIVLLYIATVLISFAIMFYCKVKLDIKMPYTIGDLIKFSLVPILNIAVLAPAILAECNHEK